MTEAEAPQGPPPLDKDARLWATFCHLSSFLGYIGIPLGHMLGPLVVWLIKREDCPFVDQEGKESLNFQISMTIYYAASILLCFLLVGFFLIFCLLVFNLVVVIIASIKANEGVGYRYPMAIRFIS